MKAVVRGGDERGARLETRPVPSRPAGWVRLRVLLAGICRTDVHAAEGRLALGGERTLGHEMVGEVEEADSGSAFAPGARVTVSPLVGCGICPRCAHGARCGTPRMLGVDLDGAFAEGVVVPETCLYHVPPELSARRAAYVEPVAAALAVLRAPIRPGERGAVLGAGRIAELTSRVLRAHGFVTAEASDAESDADLDFVVEAAGTDEMIARALKLVRPGGVVVLKSRPPTPLAVDVARAVRNDIRLAAVSYGPFEDAVRLAGSLAIDDLLGDVYPLERFAAAMELTRAQPLGPKIFLRPAGEG